MTTWLHYPFSHPWMPTLKRKYSDDGSEGDSTPSPPATSPCSPGRASHHLPKRRRYDLSRNLSRLSLFERIYPIIEEPQQQQRESFPMSDAPLDLPTMITEVSRPLDSGFEEMDADVDIPNRTITAIVEEPIEFEPSVPQVRMRGCSSYEPEKDRIVITDLESSDSESEQDDSKPYTISSKVLSKLNAANRHPLLTSVHPDILIEADPSKAIVLYRPVPWTPSNPSPSNVVHQARDEDAMDLE